MKRLHIQIQPTRSPGLGADAAVARLQSLAEPFRANRLASLTH